MIKTAIITPITIYSVLGLVTGLPTPSVVLFPIKSVILKFSKSEVTSNPFSVLYVVSSSISVLIEAGGFGGFGAPATTSSGGFGFGSSFTASQPQQSSFGGTSFGAPAASAAPAFGTSFGAPASTSSAFGSTFGTPASATPAFGSTFGTTTAQTGGGLFGTATTKPSLFGSTATSTPNLFSTPASGTTNLFGSAPTQSSSLFGTTTTSTPSLFGTTPTANTGFGTSGGLFGTATTTAPSLFGTAPAGQSTFGTGLFGTTTTTAPSLFGGFGTTTTTSSGFKFGGGFGTTTTAPLFGSTFGPKPATTVPTTPVSKNQQFVASIYAINVFNDERDAVLKKWNLLQASWGVGKGYYSTTQPPIEYNSQNPFYRFKAIGYNAIPEHDNSEGIVRLVFNKKYSEMKGQTDFIKNGITGILGNKPNLSVDVFQIKAVSDSQTEVKVTVSEKGVTGSVRKIAAFDLAAFLNQPGQKQQLTNVGVSLIAPFVTPSKAELEEFLKVPPEGIEKQMWEAAIADNPNPKKFIPVPINGFADLRSRMLNQEHQTGLHQAFMEKVNNEISQLKTKHAASIAQINELKQKFLEMQHRILKVLVKQESTRKVGLAIQPEEEMLRGRLEMIESHLNIPRQYKSQINELLSHVKMLEGSNRQYYQNYKIDEDVQQDIKQFLKMQQAGISKLVDIVQNDLQAIKIINEGLLQATRNY